MSALLGRWSYMPRIRPETKTPTTVSRSSLLVCFFGRRRIQFIRDASHGYRFPTSSVVSHSLWEAYPLQYPSKRPIHVQVTHLALHSANPPLSLIPLDHTLNC